MPRLTPALAGLLLAAAPATADITPREVWEDWVASVQQDDAEISTEAVDETADGLVIRGLSMIAGSEDTERYEISVDEVSLMQNPDGTVRVTSSPEYPIVLTDTGDDGELRETRLLVRHPDLEMTVSDDDGVRMHAFVAPRISVTLEEATEDGEPIDINGGATLFEAEGRYDVADAGEGESALTAARLAVELSGTDTDSGGDFDVAFSMEDIDSSNMLQLAGSEMAEVARGLAEGSSRLGTLASGSTAFRLDSESDGEQMTLDLTMGAGETRLLVVPEGLTYESASEAARLAVSGSALPLPEIAIEIGTLASDFSAPLIADEEAQPYALGISMLEVAVDEGLWNMVDPAGILPRDPGAIVLDVSGYILVEQDVGAADMADAGGEVQTLSLDTLRIALAGAEVLATGLLDLVETDEGETRPVGEVDLELTGVQDLLARLVQAGILPQQQAMGAQMMIGMFAQPGANDGELVSNIRLTEDGRIFINDQQVQ